MIKKIVKEYPTGEGFAYESTEHYGTSRWPGFIEHKELARSSPDSLYSFKWWVYSYERFIYDSSGRKLAWIRYHPTMSRRIIWRTDYRYDSTGKQTSTLSRVPTEKFWD